MNVRNNKGFTLIELIIVIIILGVLATLGFPAFNSSQQKSRDARRKNDLRQISLALEAYNNDYGKYPAYDSSTGKIKGCGDSTSPSPCDWGNKFQFSTPSTSPIYMIKLPKDYKTAFQYYYQTQGTGFNLYAQLENKEDPDYIAAGYPNVVCGTEVGKTACNYAFSSSNLNIVPTPTP